MQFSMDVSWMMKYLIEKAQVKHKGWKAYSQTLHKQDKNNEIKDSVSILFNEL